MKIEHHFILIFIIFLIIITILYTYPCDEFVTIGKSGNTKLDNMPIWSCSDPKNKFSKITDVFVKQKRLQSQGLFDKWSITHITHGYILFVFLYFINNYKKNTSLFYAALALEIFWEYFENKPDTIKQYRKLRNLYRDYVGDSLINIVSDVLFAYFGLILSWYLPLTVNIIIIGILEVTSYFSINDIVLLTLFTFIFKVFNKVYEKCYKNGIGECVSKVNSKIYEKLVKVVNNRVMYKYY